MNAPITNPAALTPMDAKTLAAKLARGEVTLIDIRETDEFAREHIKGAHSMPMSIVAEELEELGPKTPVVFHCRSGVRTAQNCDALAHHVKGQAFVLTGGIDAWKAASLPVSVNKKAPLELMRQVQITIGTLSLIGVLLTLFVNINFIAIPAFLGAGLVFAGTTGWCGMAKLLAIMPWNRPHLA